LTAKVNQTVKENWHSIQRNIHRTELVYWLLVSLALTLTSPVGHSVQDVKWNQPCVCKPLFVWAKNLGSFGPAVPN
jgi:hypothetical protein